MHSFRADHFRMAPCLTTNRAKQRTAFETVNPELYKGYKSARALLDSGGQGEVAEQGTTGVILPLFRNYV